MAWSYLHFKIVTENQMSIDAASAEGTTPLEKFLNMYGDSNWELIYVKRTGNSYELIFKATK